MRPKGERERERESARNANGDGDDGERSIVFFFFYCPRQDGLSLVFSKSFSFLFCFYRSLSA